MFVVNSSLVFVCHRFLSCLNLIGDAKLQNRVLQDYAGLLVESELAQQI